MKYFDHLLSRSTAAASGTLLHKYPWNAVPLIAVLVSVLGCGTNRVPAAGAVPTAPRLSSLPPVPVDAAYLLEHSGLSPRDTTISFPASVGRTILVRHAPPDNAIYAIVKIPPDSTTTGTTELVLRNHPGRYSVGIVATPAPAPGSTLTFSFAMHLRPPSGALDNFRTLTRFANSLGIAQMLPGDRLQFLDETRPAADMLTAPITTNGQYMIAVPK